MGGFVQGEDGVYRELPGYRALWNYFGCSRASWITLPRSLMHEMPDRWQARMAVLLREFDEVYANLPDFGDVSVCVKKDGRYAKLPDWVEYRHPDVTTIKSFQRVE